MSSRKQESTRLNAFDPDDKSLNAVADEIYGAAAGSGLDTGRMVARAIDIDGIWADARQPRRAVPASIRLHWNGDPKAVAALLEQWHIVATKAAGREINIYDVLQARGEGISTEGMPALAAEYIELLRLAASIAEEGLINPIRVVKQRERYLIESGERRWLAYWLLKTNMGDMKWNRIAAHESDGKSLVWKQAAENTQRRSLNAIGMARQLALLIMDTRKGLDGQRYDEFEDIVLPGECDRRFYAQVANGNIHRIPKGMGERIQAAMGLGMEQISQYRRLLRLTDDDVVNDALWMRGDVENWAEKTLREITSTLTAVKVREVVERAEWTLDDLRAEPLTPGPSPQGRGEMDPVPAPQRTPPPDPSPLRREGSGTEWTVGTWVIVPSGYRGEITAVNGRLIRVKGPNGERNYDMTLLRAAGQQALIPMDPTPVQTPPPTPSPLSGEGKEDTQFEIGWAVTVQHTGQVGEVQALGDGLVLVHVDGDPSWFTPGELIDLDMRFEDFVRMEVAEGVTWDNPTPGPSPLRREGSGEVLSQKDEELGYAPPAPPERLPSEVHARPLPGSDNEDSLARVIDIESAEAFMMMHLGAAFRAGNDAETAKVLEELRGFRRDAARRLAQNGMMQGVLASYYEHLASALNSLLTEHLNGVLNQIEKAGHE